MKQIPLDFSPSSRFEIQATVATIAGGIVVEDTGAHSIDLAWPWWRPNMRTEPQSREA